MIFSIFPTILLLVRFFPLLSFITLINASLKSDPCFFVFFIYALSEFWSALHAAIRIPLGPILKDPAPQESNINVNSQFGGRASKHL
jgi:hypothetical protein